MKKKQKRNIVNNIYINKIIKLKKIMKLNL